MSDGPWSSQGVPPPPPVTGNIPAVRLKSEIAERRPEPPACVQNAMMTKDKKPFTYTPGGIDLSEIKSPRMARRIERNANAPGVGEIPKNQHNYHQSGPLPPSALAAMQPALPVQVFPLGPPPPPPMQAPPPPPPPMQPLPTKPVATNEGVFERPDMTRIIPENPMALLRKTPRVERKSFVDEIGNFDSTNIMPNKQQPQRREEEPQRRDFAPQFQQPPRMEEYIPVQQGNGFNGQPRGFSNQQPNTRMNQNGAQQPQSKPINSNVGSLYIPPVPVEAQCVQSPPTPPQRQAQSPQSPIPKLNAAPKPWQTPKKEQEIPEWAQRPQREEINQSGRIMVQPPNNSPIQQYPQVQPMQSPRMQPTSPNEYQQRMQQPPSPMQQNQQYQQRMQQPHSPMQQNQQYQQPPSPMQYQQRMQQPPSPMQQNRMQPPPPKPGVEVVWVTQPEVYIHPGPGPAPQRYVQPPNNEPAGTRVIPIKIEGTPSPTTNDRNFNRQQSWTPTQSNSFKVIQKITNTDGDEDDESQVLEHGPRTSQQFPNEQMRKMNLSDVPQEQRGPKVRTIPIQLEGDEPQRYVHPSQQTVQEPKKYTGSAIPSKAFKMVQAMTSNTLADGNNQTENYESNDPSSAYENWGYENHWQDYYPYYYPNPNFIGENRQCKTPVPFWGYPYPPPPPPPHPGFVPKYESSSDTESETKLCSSCRTTPVCDSSRNTPSFDYSGYWDPYYYGYYYGYPMYSYPGYYPSDYDGYSSNDEIVNLMAKKMQNGSHSNVRQNLQRDQNLSDGGDISSNTQVDYDESLQEASNYNNAELNHSNYYKQHEEIYNPPNKYNHVDDIRDDISETTVVEDPDVDADSESSDAEESIEEITKNIPRLEIYDEDDTPSEGSEEDREEIIYNDETIPHVLSVIFEESERSDCSRLDRYSRESSVVSDDTVVDDNSDQEVVSVKLPLKLSYSKNSDEVTHVTVGMGEVNSFPWSDVSTEFICKSPENDVETSITLKIRSRSTSCNRLSDDDDGNISDQSCDDIISNICGDKEDDDEHKVSDICLDDVRKEEDDDIDFWSQIKQDDDVLPKRNSVYNNYRNSYYNIEDDNVEANETTCDNLTTVQEDGANLIVENIKNEESSQVITRNLSGDDKENQIVNIKECQVTTSHKHNEENYASMTNGLSKISQEHKVVSQKKGDTETTVDTVSNTIEDVVSNVSVKVTEDSLENVRIDDYKLSQLVFEKNEVKEILKPPTFDLGLEECFKSIKKKINYNQNLEDIEIPRTIKCVKEKGSIIINNVNDESLVNKNQGEEEVVFANKSDERIVLEKPNNTNLTDIEMVNREDKKSPQTKKVKKIIRKVIKEKNTLEDSKVNEVKKVAQGDLVATKRCEGDEKITKCKEDNTINVREEIPVISKTKVNKLNINEEVVLNKVMKKVEEIKPVEKTITSKLIKKIEIPDKSVQNVTTPEVATKIKNNIIEDIKTLNKVEEIKVKPVEKVMKKVEEIKPVEKTITSKVIKKIEVPDKSVEKVTTPEVVTKIKNNISEDIKRLNKVEEIKVKPVEKVMKKVEEIKPVEKTITSKVIKKIEVPDKSVEKVTTPEVVTKIKNNISEDIKPCDEIARKSKLMEENKSPQKLDEKSNEEISLSEDKQSNNSSSLNSDDSDSDSDSSSEDSCSSSSSDRSYSSSRLDKRSEEKLNKELSDYNNNTAQQDFYVPTIKERIRALHNASKNSNAKSSKISNKTEDNSEDDIDSGVTSDMSLSRHISDNEADFPELRKMNKYQRAATHSRLYKLLQGECDEEEETEDNNYRKENLTLPLNTTSSGYDSFSSSCINSPSSPINEKLVNELIASLLRKKKGKALRNIPMEKLKAAAIKILQEERDVNHVNQSQEDSCYPSPLRSDSSTIETPQEFYSNNSEYKQYYNSFSDYSSIVPSKAFKLIQEHAVTNKGGNISGFSAKCPRVISSKNLPKDLESFADDNPANQSAPPAQ